MTIFANNTMILEAINAHLQELGYKTQVEQTTDILHSIRVNQTLVRVVIHKKSKNNICLIKYLITISLVEGNKLNVVYAFSKSSVSISGLEHTYQEHFNLGDSYYVHPAGFEVNLADPEALKQLDSYLLMIGKTV